ncbi:Sec-independent protein translocase protein tatB [Granulibacter bethesdensis]|uniref:Sec-independent protein translocase protein TatB n=1 Tax=Granulibacter bethesdensis TaxID=364410 RepID=A0AAC9KA61_9PROT|nr:Sec-independent protein translocase protein TatB [Granulibacter bethesdensis]APH54552.1 Sec-independent protein translocase protein tatB [Granulibacter bethesdensis]APH62138.1 Sec-independent protein translocase protein tatB [Granulibacter bethesdensis]
MFDFAWSEIAVIGVVALVVIGPKDIPGAMRGVARMVRKARSMAADFQGQMDQMMKEADLGEVRETFNDLRGVNLRHQLSRTLDPDGSMRSTFNSNPMAPSPAPMIMGGDEAHTVAERPFHSLPVMDERNMAPEWTMENTVSSETARRAATAPAFIPPEEAFRSARRAPAFIPPADQG